MNNFMRTSSGNFGNKTRSNCSRKQSKREATPGKITLPLLTLSLLMVVVVVVGGGGVGGGDSRLSPI